MLRIFNSHNFGSNSYLGLEQYSLEFCLQPTKSFLENHLLFLASKIKQNFGQNLFDIFFCCLYFQVDRSFIERASLLSRQFTTTAAAAAMQKKTFIDLPRGD